MVAKYGGESSLVLMALDDVPPVVRYAKQSKTSLKSGEPTPNLTTKDFFPSKVIRSQLSRYLVLLCRIAQAKEELL